MNANLIISSGKNFIVCFACLRKLSLCKLIFIIFLSRLTLPLLLFLELTVQCNGTNCCHKQDYASDRQTLPDLLHRITRL